MLNIAPALIGQSDKYIQVWLYIFNTIAEGSDTMAVNDILVNCKVTRQGFYEIINRGLRLFNEHNIHVTIYRKHTTDKNIIVNVAFINQSTKPKQTSTNTTTEQTNIQPTKRTKNINEQQNMVINAIVTYLNEVTGKNYRPDNATTVRLILARLNNGFTLEQFKYVIDIKANHWLNSDMEKYLRPETLFGNKFDGYLNETITTKQPSSPTEQAIRNAEETLNRDWGVGT
jgi:uncharacterized phage protein (TIGR02220 family)